VEVEPGAGALWMAGVEAGAKNFQIVEPEPEIWVPVPQIFCGANDSYK